MRYFYFFNKPVNRVTYFCLRFLKTQLKGTFPCNIKAIFLKYDILGHFAQNCDKKIQHQHILFTPTIDIYFIYPIAVPNIFN